MCVCVSLLVCVCLYPFPIPFLLDGLASEVLPQNRRKVSEGDEDRSAFHKTSFSTSLPPPCSESPKHYGKIRHTSSGISLVSHIVITLWRGHCAFAVSLFFHFFFFCISRSAKCVRKNKQEICLKVCLDGATLPRKMKTKVKPNSPLSTKIIGHQFLAHVLLPFFTSPHYYL